MLIKKFLPVLDVKTNEELKTIMADVPLTQPQVAELTESSLDAVKSWCTNNPDRARNMPKGKLKLLKLMVDELRETRPRSIG